MDILRHSCWALGGNFQGVVFLQLSTCLYAPCKAKERFPNKKRPCSENRKLLGGGGGGVVLKYGERKFLPSPTPSLSLTFVPRLLSGYALFQFWFFIFGSMDSSPSNQSFKSLNRCPAYLGAYSEGALLCHIGKKKRGIFIEIGESDVAYFRWLKMVVTDLVQWREREECVLNLYQGKRTGTESHLHNGNNTPFSKNDPRVCLYSCGVCTRLFRGSSMYCKHLYSNV